MALPPDADGTLSLIHVDDLARALMTLIPVHEDLTARIFEVDDGQIGGWTQADFARAIGRAVGKRIRPVATPRFLLELAAKADRLVRKDKAKLTADRVSYFCHDDWTIDPAKRLPHQLWNPKIDTGKGLKDTAQWYRLNDWL